MQPSQPPMYMQLIPFVFMMVVLYFLMIRPQARKQKAQAEFLQKLKRGDEVVTSSGILGTVEGLTEKFITLEIAPNVRIKILRSQVATSALTASEVKAT
jgi:preprotein translocase subunit YajC